jgi:hypothetical protein
LFTKKEISAKHNRYIILLQDFLCTMIHISRKNNVVADILSRYSVKNIRSDELDDFKYIVLLEQENLRYEILLEYIYQYLTNLNFEQIPQEYQKRVHIERGKYIIHEEKLYKKSTYRLLIIPEIKDRNAVMKELHDRYRYFR